MGCHLCQDCYRGNCNWGIAAQDPYLTKRLNPNIDQRRLTNLLRAWSLEIKEMIGGMGINATESLRGRVQEAFWGKEVGMVSLGFGNRALLKRYVGQYGAHFGLEVDGLLDDEYIRLVPKTKRPYGQLYAY